MLKLITFVLHYDRLGNHEDLMFSARIKQCCYIINKIHGKKSYGTGAKGFGNKFR